MAAMEAEGRLAICGYTPYKPDELPVAAVEEKDDHTTIISQLEEANLQEGGVEPSVWKPPTTAGAPI